MTHRLAIVASLSLAWLFPGSAVGGELENLTRLVGTGDVLGDVTLELAGKAHVAGRYVLFIGYGMREGGVGVGGLWLWDGSDYELVVDTTSPGDLSTGSHGVDHTGLVAVDAVGYGVLGWRAGELFPIALNGAQAPVDPPGPTFLSFAQPVLKDGVVYFLAALTGLPVVDAVRVFRWSESTGLEEVTLPNLCCFGTPALAEDGFLIDATDPLNSFEEYAIWRRDGEGELSEFFRFRSQFPGAPPGAYWLPDYRQAGTVAGGVVIRAEDSAHTRGGIYRITDEVEPVFLSGDPDPETGVPIDSTGREFSVRADRVAFRIGGFLDDQPLRIVLQDSDRSLRSIVARGENLEGQSVAIVDLTHGGLGEERLAVAVLAGTDEGSDEAVWLLELPRGPNPLEVPGAGQRARLILIAALAAAGMVLARETP